MSATAERHCPPETKSSHIRFKYHGVTVRGKVDAPPWAIIRQIITCNEQHDTWYTTHNMTCYRWSWTCYILYVMRTVYVFPYICTCMCMSICMCFVYYAHAICSMYTCFSMVSTTVFFARGPPTWCINLSKYGIRYKTVWQGLLCCPTKIAIGLRILVRAVPPIMREGTVRNGPPPK
jgi:hypothetical protein